MHIRWFHYSLRSILLTHLMKDISPKRSVSQQTLWTSLKLYHLFNLLTMHEKQLCGPHQLTANQSTFRNQVGKIRTPYNLVTCRTKYFTWFWEIVANPSLQHCFTSLGFEGILSYTSLLKSHHSICMGLRSGLWLAHSNPLFCLFFCYSSSLEIHVLICWGVCGGLALGFFFVSLNIKHSDLGLNLMGCPILVRLAAVLRALHL